MGFVSHFEKFTAWSVKRLTQQLYEKSTHCAFINIIVLLTVTPHPLRCSNLMRYSVTSVPARSMTEQTLLLVNGFSLWELRGGNSSHRTFCNEGVASGRTAIQSPGHPMQPLQLPSGWTMWSTLGTKSVPKSAPVHALDPAGENEALVHRNSVGAPAQAKATGRPIFDDLPSTI